jgi:hypothetical protein
MPTVRRWWDDWKVDYPDMERGPWRIERFEVTKEQADAYNMRQMFQMMSHGIRTGPRDVPPGTYTRLLHAERGVVMSDTPAELRDLAGIKNIADAGMRTFLINGLGLGIVPRNLLKYPTVEHIDVVEVDADVIALTGEQFRGNPRIAIHHADALEMEWPRGTKWDVAWHDIWDTISVANWPSMVKLHRKYGRRTTYQASWCRYAVEAQVRQMGVDAKTIAAMERYEKGGPR